MADPPMHRFPGVGGIDSPLVLVVAGIHVSEQSGIEVAHWIRVKLEKRETPTACAAVVVPELFVDAGKRAREAERTAGRNGAHGALQPFRELGNEERKNVPAGDEPKPGRQFPAPGQPLASLMVGGGYQVSVDYKKRPLLPEIAFLIRLVEQLKPVRIVSVHGKLPRSRKHIEDAVKEGQIVPSELASWDDRDPKPVYGVNFPGIFVDPRYEPDDGLCGTHKSESKKCREFDKEACKFDKYLDPAFPLKQDGRAKRFDSAITLAGKSDDHLALGAAMAVADPALVAGNHVRDKVHVVHYAKEGDTPCGFSLGDWGPVEVRPRKATGNGPPPLGTRPGAPVFTIEVKDNYESWAFVDGVQIVSEDGTVLTPEPTSEERATGRKPRTPKPPQDFDQKRSKELQSYAEAIIKVIIDTPVSV